MGTTWLAAAALAALIGAPTNETRVTALPAQAYAQEAESAWTRIAHSDAPARWRTQVCPGVTGLAGGNAQFMVDRMSLRAGELGLRVGPPGCTANILVVFTADADGQAQAIARERSDPASATGRSGDTAGLTAFDAFLTSDQPVRWWRVSRVMTETGEVADRNDRLNEPPRVNVPERGRLGSTTFDSYSHVVVIVDLRQVNGVNLGALADYVAMVSLSPAEPGTAGGSSVLNLFAGGAAPSALTEADRAYLQTVYR